MRWFVDVSSMGKKAETQKFCVESDSWQRALQAARELRDDSGPLTGFSIELLDDGFSALDPVKRLRYAIRKAPADSRLTTVAPAAQPVASPSVAPEKRTPTEPPGPAPAPASDTSAASEVRSSNIPKALSSRPPAPDLQLSPKPAGRARIRSNAGMQAVVVPPPGTFPGSIEVIARREQDPGAESPLTYREYAYYVDGTPDWEEAEMLLRDQLEVVQQAISAAPKGKLVNLALFNVRFRGRPPMPPLATLTWKDWLGDAVLSFPESTGAAAIPLTVAKPSSRPPAAAPRGREELATDPSPAPAHVDAAPTSSSTARPASVSPAAPVAKSVSVSPAAPVAKPAPSQAPKPAAPVAPVAPVETTSKPAASVPPAQPAPASKPAHVAPAEPPPSPSRSDAPVPPAALDSSAPPTSRGSNMPPPVEVQPPVLKARLRGDELIADLFEVMHDLQFLRDAVEGAEFCLALALEKMPAHGGIVHLFDIDRREFVITCAGGAGGESLLLQRCAESDPVLSAAMRKHRPLVFADAQTSRDVRSIGRYAALGGAISLIVAPVQLGGRFLGAIELLNPVDDGPFTDDDGHALSYIAEKLAAFVGEHGIQIDRDQPAERGRSAGAR
jgi:hypothetical protein